jgi:MraZ protein
VEFFGAFKSTSKASLPEFARPRAEIRLVRAEEPAQITEQGSIRLNKVRHEIECRGRRRGKTMFRGNHPAKVDEKGRLKLPAAFKQLLDAANVTQFYITSSTGARAEIWPLPEWEKREVEMAELGTMDEDVSAYLDVTSYYGHQVEADNQARVLLPQILRGEAKLDAEVMVIGKLTHLEVSNREKVERDLPEKKMTGEKSQRLSDKLKRRNDR